VVITETATASTGHEPNDDDGGGLVNQTELSGTTVHHASMYRGRQGRWNSRGYPCLVLFSFFRPTHPCLVTPGQFRERATRCRRGCCCYCQRKQRNWPWVGVDTVVGPRGPSSVSDFKLRELQTLARYGVPPTDRFRTCGSGSYVSEPLFSTVTVEGPIDPPLPNNPIMCPPLSLYHEGVDMEGNQEASPASILPSADQPPLGLPESYPLPPSLVLSASLHPPRVEGRARHARGRGPSAGWRRLPPFVVWKQGSQPRVACMFGGRRRRQWRITTQEPRPLCLPADVHALGQITRSCTTPVGLVSR
jgi:hypothetical protein